MKTSEYRDFLFHKITEMEDIPARNAFEKIFPRKKLKLDPEKDHEYMLDFIALYEHSINQMKDELAKMSAYNPLRLLRQRKINSAERSFKEYLANEFAKRALKFGRKKCTCTVCVNYGPIEDSKKKKDSEKALQGLYNATKNRKMSQDSFNKLKNDKKRAIGRHLKNPEDYRLRSNSLNLYILGEFKECIRTCDEAIKNNPKCAYAYYNRARCQLRLENDDAALKDYDKALELDEELVDAYIDRSKIKFVLGDVKGALQDINTAAKVDPKDIEVYYVRGQFRMGLEEYDNAIMDFTAALELNPTDKLSQEALSEAVSLRDAKRHRVVDR